MVLKNRIHVEYKSIVDMIADGLTKALITVKFTQFVKTIDIKRSIIDKNKI